MSTLKYSRQREAIKNFLMNRNDHPTADTIYTCLREEYPNISLGTVYRNLSLLEEIGEISKISVGSGADHYDGDTTQHQHFICTRCNQVYDIQIKNIDSIAKSFNIKPILLFNEETAKMAKKLPVRVDMYRKNK